MNRVALSLDELRRRGRKAFAPYVMAGYPDMETTECMLRGLADSGADLIEVGIPFSDPVADGPTNQAAAQEALRNGATLDRIFALLSAVTPDLPCPVLLFSYLNPLIQRGIGPFVQQAVAAGAAGLIVPDLPPEAATELAAAAERASLGMTFLVAPTSTSARIRLAHDASTGFLYAVSVRGVTGARRDIPPDLPEFIGRVRQNTDRPVLVGFGISQPEQARSVASLADGVIVASALVGLLGTNGVEAACRLAEEMRAAI